MKILLVEDDIMLNEMITEYLASTGHVIKVQNQEMNL